MDKKKFTINLDDSAFTTDRPQVKSLFKASSRSDETPGEPTARAAQPPLSYAEFIIQRKGHAATSGDAGAQGIGEQGASAKQAAHSETADAGVGVHQSAAAPVEAQEEAARSDAALSSGPKPAGTGSSIIVSPRQRGNPILKFVRSVPWEFGEIVPDYVLGPTTCALFLSLRYHNLHPNYIHDRLKNLGQTFTLRVLLVQVDVKDPHHALKELARICIMADCTLILAWSPEEAGRYLETYKAYEKKPADLLKEQVEKDFLSKVTDCLTTVKSINRTDAITLLSTFSSLEGVMNASKEDLALCPGLGPQKARRLYDVLHQPFLKSKRKAEA